MIIPMTEFTIVDMEKVNILHVFFWNLFRKNLDIKVPIYCLSDTCVDILIL